MGHIDTKYSIMRRRRNNTTASDLHVAIYSDNINLIRECVKNKEIINSFWRGCTPVSSAIYLKRHDALVILVTAGADVNLCSRNNRMEPPLFAAVRLEAYKAQDILLMAKQLDVNQKDFFGRTALWAAARYATADVVELLLNRGAKINAKYDSYLLHPMNAAMQRSKNIAGSIVRILIRRGCLETVLEESLLKWAVRNVDENTFRLLVRAGYKVKCEPWLAYEELPDVWKTDSSFCDWIQYLQKNPPSLFNLTICSIRNILSTKYFSLQVHHVNDLKLPSLLKDFILLN